MDWFEAARTGALDVLKICLIWGQRIDQRTREGRTALGIAAEHGRTAAVKLLLERNADPNPDATGVARPLTAAIENEHWDTAAALVRGGADPNVGGVASIVIAAPPKRPLLALMLARGLDPHGVHGEWGPYIQFALNDAPCADLFVFAGFDLARYEREAGESLLERALSNGVNRFLHLLSLGANVNLPVDRTTGRTMLMTLAAEEPSEPTHALIRLLVKRGADLAQTDADGRGALDYAMDTQTRAILTRDDIIRAEAREQKKQTKAASKARTAEAAKATRRRNAAAKKGAIEQAAAERAAAEERAASDERAAADKRAASSQSKQAARARRARRASTGKSSPRRESKPVEKTNPSRRLSSAKQESDRV